MLSNPSLRKNLCKSEVGGELQQTGGELQWTRRLELAEVVGSGLDITHDYRVHVHRNLQSPGAETGGEQGWSEGEQRGNQKFGG